MPTEYKSSAIRHLNDVLASITNARQGLPTSIADETEAKRLIICIADQLRRCSVGNLEKIEVKIYIRIHGRMHLVNTDL